MERAAEMGMGNTSHLRVLIRRAPRGCQRPIQSKVVPVDVLGEMNGAVLGHDDCRDVKQDHLNRIGEIDCLGSGDAVS